MKLPEFIPQVSKPLHPAYGGAWEAMTPNERRWSWLFDATLVVIVVIAVILAS